MRIIAGNFKGKKIIHPTDKQTRPLKDIVKESIFNILTHSNKLNTRIKDSNILDLFSGTGSFGLEALSRGAIFVTFIDNYSNVLSVLRQNIINFKTENKTEIIEKKIDDQFDFGKLRRNYEIIFIDPPFKDNAINSIIEKIIVSKILKKDGIIIMHRHNKSSDKITDKIKILEIKSYGNSKIFFMTTVF